MKQKLNNNKGLTLMEMLCTVVIVVIMSALLVTGMALAANTMASSVTASEARVLCDTLTTRLCYFINRDGYNDDRITVLDASGNPTDLAAIGELSQTGELAWRGNILVPSKTYPTMAGAKIKLIGETKEKIDDSSDAEEITIYELELGVYNRKTGVEYCHNIIQIQGDHAVVDGTATPSPSPTLTNSEQNALQVDD